MCARMRRVRSAVHAPTYGNLCILQQLRHHQGGHLLGVKVPRVHVVTPQHHGSLSVPRHLLRRMRACASGSGTKEAGRRGRRRSREG